MSPLSILEVLFIVISLTTSPWHVKGLDESIKWFFITPCMISLLLSLSRILVIFLGSNNAVMAHVYLLQGYLMTYTNLAIIIIHTYLRLEMPAIALCGVFIGIINYGLYLYRMKIYFFGV